MRKPMNECHDVSGAWLLPYRPLVQQVLLAAQSQSVARPLAAAHPGNSPVVRFVDQAALPAGEPYESFIARTGCVPTRDTLHDLLNGVMWLTWPRAKQRLNSL